MAKRINLQDYISYRKKLSETVVKLDEIGDSVYSCMVDLATSGILKEWAEARPLALDYELPEEMLYDTGDKCIDALVDVLDALDDAIELLSSEAGDMAE